MTAIKHSLAEKTMREIKLCQISQKKLANVCKNTQNKTDLNINLNYLQIATMRHKTIESELSKKWTCTLRNET